jgi:hypothetical protein
MQGASNSQLNFCVNWAGYVLNFVCEAYNGRNGKAFLCHAEIDLMHAACIPCLARLPSVDEQ